MATLKDIKTKIGAVKKTKQITKAMNMVATSKLRGAQSTMERFRPYAGKFAEVLGSMAESAGADSSPLLVPREQVQKVHLILCTSDRGLCGGFNTSLIQKAAKFLEHHGGPDIEFSLTCFGKKARDWARKQKVAISDQHVGIVGAKFGFNIAAISGKKIIDAFLDGTYDEVHVIYSEFISVARQVPVIRQVLPIPPIEAAETEVPEADKHYLPEHICEPSVGEMLGELLPRSVYVAIYRALLETSTSEHAARMTAMDNATKACNDMIDNLTLVYNKARQAAITADLMDIVGGAEALKG
jgi:F-type H+-transporting ATPase subunit gamma